MCPPPSASRVCRDYEEIERMLLDFARCIISPFTHRVTVRDDTRARLQLLKEFRAHLQIDLRPEVEHHDRGITDVCIKKISLIETNEVRDPRTLGILFALPDALGIHIDAHASCPQLLCRHYHN